MTKMKIMEQLNKGIDFVNRPFQVAGTRFVSIILALALSALLLVNPSHIADSAAELNHGYLTLLMMALSAAFVHGLGFNPIFWLWKIVFSPYFSWPVMFIFIYYIFK